LCVCVRSCVRAFVRSCVRVYVPHNRRSVSLQRRRQPQRRQRRRRKSRRRREGQVGSVSSTHLAPVQFNVCCPLQAGGGFIFEQFLAP
jgi:hypothetical protein